MSNNPYLQCDSQSKILEALGLGPRAIGKTNTSVRAVLEAILASRFPGACKTHVDLTSSEEPGVVPFNLAEEGIFHTESGKLQTLTTSGITLDLTVVSTCSLFLLIIVHVHGAAACEPLVFSWKSFEA